MLMIYTTCPDKETAEALAHALLEQQVIACANIIEGMTSLYRWEGQIAHEAEVVMLLKTTAERADQVYVYLENHHPYEVPCIISLNPDECYPPFAAWVNSQTIISP